MTDARKAVTAVDPYLSDLIDVARERGLRLRYIQAGDYKAGSPVIDGDDLMEPGCVWTVYLPPKKRGRE